MGSMAACGGAVNVTLTTERPRGYPGHGDCTEREEEDGGLHGRCHGELRWKSHDADLRWKSPGRYARLESRGRRPSSAGWRQYRLAGGRRVETRGWARHDA